MREIEPGEIERRAEISRAIIASNADIAAARKAFMERFPFDPPEVEFRDGVSAALKRRLAALDEWNRTTGYDDYMRGKIIEANRRHGVPSMWGLA